MLSLSVIQDLAELVERADALWPAHPELVPRYEAWLAQARELQLVPMLMTHGEVLRRKPALLELLPDVQIFYNAVHYALKYDEFFKPAEITVARKMLAQLVTEKWLTAKAVFGFFPANRVQEDDVAIYADEQRSGPVEILHHLRQQKSLADNLPNACLADFVAPHDSGLRDYLGAFVVTAGPGIDSHVAAFERDLDDYSAILLKALADRLAEACAEYLHAEVRRRYWGYAPEEKLTSEQLVAENYRGIRPAPGYPACPDHTEKATLWKLLDVERNIGVQLTESFVMMPAASVSGFYFAHAKSRYFAVGRIGRDQVADYAQRKGQPLTTVERWLASNLAYDPEKDLKPVILIAGGKGKGQDFGPLAEAARGRVRRAILIGQDRVRIRAALEPAGIPAEDAESMDDAVRRAREAARMGDVVLLSPACASFDMFRNFEHRGDVFKSVVRALLG